MRPITFPKVLLACAAIAVGMAAAPVWANPCDKLTLVVGYSPGGTGDIVASAISDAVSRKLNRPVVIDPRPGGSGSIAAGSVAKAAPDGCTLLVGQTAEIAVNPVVIRKLGYDPLRDLQPIALLATVPLALVVPRAAPYASLTELTEAARTAKPAMTFASAGRSTPGYFAGELLRLRTRADLAHISFDGGADAMGAVLSGKAAFYFAALPTALQDRSKGQIRILAVSSAQRTFAVPEVPTLEESGFAPFNLDLWVGLFAPRAVSSSVVMQLNKVINEVLLEPDIRRVMLERGVNVRPMSVEQFTSYVAAETSRYATLIDSEFCVTCPW
jgi:tripartite-type tricarboxylate transporter receptor subunit TctC